MKQLTFKFAVLICALFATITVSAQTNLLLNSNADSESEHWRAIDQATVEEFNGNKVFVIRNAGSFQQDVKITEADTGKFALLIGRGSSERINADGAITGLPYLYGYMLDSGDSSSGKIYANLLGQQTLAKPRVKDEWVTMFGIYQVPQRTGRIRFFLFQAGRRGVPHNGSAARFDNLGLYLFDTKEDALRFVRQF